MNSILNQIDNKNPVQRMLEANPKYKEVMKEIEENGGDAKSLFFKKAKEMGVDPNVILSMLNN